MAIAPAQNNAPIPYGRDPYGEEATFLKIFGGHLMNKDVHERVTLQGRCKSFIRRYDRRCATNIPYLFYMYRKLMTQKLTSAINVSLRKSSVRNRNITVKDVLNTSQLVQALDDQDYQKFMKMIRSTPQYWVEKKKQLFGMIRQLGCPTFFVTFSPAEIDWPELLLILYKLNEPDQAKQDAATVEQMAALPRQEKIDLVSRDPVTTARYFENRMRHLLNYMFDGVRV